jgi:hypothetical protein
MRRPEPATLITRLVSAVIDTPANACSLCPSLSRAGRSSRSSKAATVALSSAGDSITGTAPARAAAVANIHTSKLAAL